MEEVKKKFSPLKAIRRYCLGCSDGSFNEVKSCPMTNCELYDFRLGHNPNRKGVGNANVGYAKNPNSTNDSETEEDEVEEIIE